MKTKIVFIIACVVALLVVAGSCFYGLSEISKKQIAAKKAEEAMVVSDKLMEEEPVVEEEEVVEETVDYEPVYYSYNYSSYDYPDGDGVLTRSGGVNYYNGNRETWYSSNVLYHYRTGEWTAGSDGVYRDSDGYVIVASSDLTQGDTVDTSLGMGKVYDSGCASGTVDIYTRW